MVGVETEPGLGSTNTSDKARPGPKVQTTPRRQEDLPDIFTPSTPDDARVLDDDNVPATRDEFRRMRRQMREMKNFIQKVMSQQAAAAAIDHRDLEEARTWATAARIAADRLKNETQ